MIREFENTGASQILVEAVDKSQVDKYGVVDLDGAELSPGESLPIKAMVEKPPVNKAPSNLAVVGRYVLPATIWDILKQTPPGAGNEIQLTDAIATLMKSSQVNAFYMTGKSHDCGGKLGYMKAFVEYSMRHGKEGAEFTKWIKSLK